MMNMATGKLVLLLVAGGMAGVAFAGMNSSAMLPYKHADARPPVIAAQDQSSTYADANVSPSWLDDGVSLLDTPAWPFGRSARAPDTQDAPYEYGAFRSHDTYEGYRANDPEAYPDQRRNDYAYDPGDYPLYGYDDEPRYDDARQGNTVDEQDAAGEAARDAADAAQDVIAAEHT